jgi:plasmid rolling circle replication initiator protein Rep
MQIIAQSGAVVNINIDKRALAHIKKKAKAAAKREERKAEAKKDHFAKWQDHKKRSQVVAAKLEAIGLEKRSTRMKYCATHLEFNECADCGTVTVTNAQLCRDRLCPTCAWRLSLKRYAMMSGIMEALYNGYPEYIYSLVTLTVKNPRPEKLRLCLEQMQEAWRSTINQRWTKDCLAGWARSIEVTYNAAAGTFHPHYHIIMMTTDFVSIENIIMEWMRHCRKQGLEVSRKAQSSVEIAPTDHKEGYSLAKSICETYKYTIKSDSLADMPLSHFKAYAEAVDGKRLISLGGKIKEMAKAMEADKLDELDEKDDNEKIDVCLKCKSVALDRIVCEWSWKQGRYIPHVDACDAVHAMERAKEIEARIGTADSLKNLAVKI